MRIYCSMQFLESPRTSDQSDLKVERQQEAPTARSRSGKVKAFGRSRWDTLDLLCFPNLERGDISRLLNSYWADSVLVKTAQQISPQVSSRRPDQRPK